MPPLRSLTLKDLHAAGTGIMDKVVNADKRDKLKAAKKARERASEAHPPASNQNENCAPGSDNAPPPAAVHRPSTTPPRRSWCLKQLRASPFGTHNLMDDVVATEERALEARNAARKHARKQAMQLKRLAGDPPSQSEGLHDRSCYKTTLITKTNTEGPIPRVIGKWTSTDGQVVTKMLQEKKDGSKFRVMRMVEGPGEGEGEGEKIDAELTRQAAIRRAPVRAAPGERRQRPAPGPADSVATAAAKATHPAQAVPVQDEAVDATPVQGTVDTAFVQDAVLSVQGVDDATATATAIHATRDVDDAAPVQDIVDTAFVQDAVRPVQGVDDATATTVLAVQDVDDAASVQNAVLSVRDAVLLVQGALPVQLSLQQIQQITHLLHVLENARADLAFKEFVRQDLF